MTAYRLEISYDGTDFAGYATQPGMRTVQDELERALEVAIGPVETVVAGRTDAGVHAKAQVVSFESADPLDIARLSRSLTKLLPDDMAINDLFEAESGFDARFSAVARHYRYRILNRSRPDPLRRHTTWHVPHRLDVEEMNAAGHHFLGEKDFASLCRKRERQTTLREVLSVRWIRAGDEVVLGIAAKAFCHQMVRSIVALCVEVGRGRVAADDVPGILEARDRNAARGAAPPQGLTLVGVDY